MKPRTLSREEEAELARSNKKVKGGHHVGFKDGSCDRSGESPPISDWSKPPNTRDSSFRDKLIGSIPGAFAKAFDLADQMDEDVYSDDEEAEVHGLLWKGMVVVKLTKETKICIRKPWSKTVIVKLVGRTVGYSYMQSKLVQLWKPSGRMDCVDLTHGFFLVQFYTKEDLDSVLDKGSWFIGDFFLSLRPWEPFFKPSTASVSSIAVWVRLHKLPIELYETDALKQIGESLGRVVGIDAHTAMEARGKYARLCVQIDVNKPLVDTILIGRFEQPVTYEGIQKLCFTCGRIGHKEEACPYMIRRGNDTATPVKVGREDAAGNSCDEHEEQWPSTDCNTTNIVEDVEFEGQYGPWMVMAKKRYGNRGTKKDAHVASMPVSGPGDSQSVPLNEGGYSRRGAEN